MYESHSTRLHCGDSEVDSMLVFSSTQGTFIPPLTCVTSCQVECIAIGKLALLSRAICKVKQIKPWLWSQTSRL